MPEDEVIARVPDLSRARPAVSLAESEASGYRFLSRKRPMNHIWNAD